MLLALLTSALLAFGASSPTLIPFQGRLTDAQGTVYSNGQYTLIFNLYDQAVGGSNLWTEAHQKVGVINGMVNVFLGSINPLTNVSFSETRHLGITIAATNVNSVAPEMVPRQMIIPAFWAKQAENSTRLAGYDWSSILVAGNDPSSGKIAALKLEPQGISVTNLSLTAQDFLAPPGAITAFAGSTIPAGWLLCDGRPLYRTEYPRLYAAISTNWGSGYTNGVKVADFNLPDLRGRTTLGAGQGTNLTLRLLGGVGGEETHTLSKSEMPIHGHPLGELTRVQLGLDNGEAYGVRTSAGTNEIAYAGGGQPHNTMMPFATVNYIIKY